MADSLRDQLIAAGYQAPKKEEKRKAAASKNKNRKKTAKKSADPKHNTKAGPPGAGSKSVRGKRPTHAASHNAAADAAAIEERKKLKAKIKVLIDDNKLADWKGEVAYRYLVDKRIRELYVTDKVQEKLADRTLAITRLNGDTYVIPRETALAILEINPQWSAFNLKEETPTGSEETEEYADFKVPDDLKW